MKKIAIIGSAGVPCRYGGFETLAEELVRKLGQEWKLQIYCSTKRYARSERHKNWEGTRLVYIPLDANGWQSIPYDILSMLHALFSAKIFCVLGVSGALMFPIIKLFSNKKLIVHLDGIEWKREKWKGLAKWYLKFAEATAVKFADEIISDNEGIREYVHKQYGKQSCLIEYGGDQAKSVKPYASANERYDFLGHPYSFKVCRIVPENNVELILEAFSKQAQRILVFVGDWKSSEFGKSMLAKYGNFENIRLLDPIYDPQELGLLRSNCFLYVHGHSAGGTNPSLVEAMYLGLPIACFDVNFNRYTTEGKALYFNDTDSLLEILSKTPVEQIIETGISMEKTAQGRYTWDRIAKAYGRLFLKLNPEKLKTLPNSTEQDRLSKTGTHN